MEGVTSIKILIKATIIMDRREGTREVFRGVTKGKEEEGKGKEEPEGEGNWGGGRGARRREGSGGGE